MAELLGTISAVASLVDLGQKLVSKTAHVIHSVRHAVDEVQAAHRELERTVAVLMQFQSNMDELDEKHVPLLKQEFLRTISRSNEECHQIFDQLEKTLNEAMPGFQAHQAGGVGDDNITWRDHARWPLSKKEVNTILLRLRTVQRDVEVQVSVVSQTVQTQTYKENKAVDRQNAQLEYRIRKSQIEAAMLRAKQAKLVLKRYEVSGDLQVDLVTKSEKEAIEENGSLISELVDNFQTPRTRHRPLITVEEDAGSGSRENQSTGRARTAIQRRPARITEPPLQNHQVNAQKPEHDENLTQSNVVGTKREGNRIIVESSTQNSDRNTHVMPAHPTAVIDLQHDPHEGGSTEVAPPNEIIASSISARSDGGHENVRQDSQGSVASEASQRQNNAEGAKQSPLSKQNIQQTSAKPSIFSSWMANLKGRPRHPAEHTLPRPTSVSAKSHYAFLLSKGSFEWSRFTLRLSYDEIAEIVDNFRYRHKSIWQYYSRIGPEQVKMLEDACEGAARGEGRDWTIVAIEITPKRARGEDIRAIKVIIKWNPSEDDPKRQKRTAAQKPTVSRRLQQYQTLNQDNASVEGDRLQAWRVSSASVKWPATQPLSQTVKLPNPDRGQQGPSERLAAQVGMDMLHGVPTTAQDAVIAHATLPSRQPRPEVKRPPPKEDREEAGVSAKSSTGRQDDSDVKIEETSTFPHPKRPDTKAPKRSSSAPVNEPNAYNSDEYVPVPLPQPYERPRQPNEPFEPILFNTELREPRMQPINASRGELAFKRKKQSRVRFKSQMVDIVRRPAPSESESYVMPIMQEAYMGSMPYAGPAPYGMYHAPPMYMQPWSYPMYRGPMMAEQMMMSSTMWNSSSPQARRIEERIEHLERLEQRWQQYQKRSSAESSSSSEEIEIIASEVEPPQPAKVTESTPPLPQQRDDLLRVDDDDDDDRQSHVSAAGSRISFASGMTSEAGDAMRRFTNVSVSEFDGGSSDDEK